MTTAESSLEKSLGLLRDQGFQAAEMQSANQFRRIIQKHIDLLGEYLAVRSRFRIVLGRRKPTMLGLLGFESQSLYAICRSLEELVRRAFQLRTEEIIVTAAYGLTQGQALALDYDALPVFERLLYLVQLCMSLSVITEDSTLRYRLLDRVCTSQQEFGRYRLEATHLENPQQLNQRLPEYGRGVILTFNPPLKLALDRGDSRAFLLALGAVGQTFQMDAVDVGLDARSIEFKLENPSLKPGERADLESRHKLLIARTDFYRVVGETKTEMSYGLGGWATKVYEQGKLQPSGFQEVFAKVSALVGEFARLSALFIESDTQLRDRYGWSTWELEELGETRGAIVGWAGTRWLEKFYVLASVKLTPTPPDEQEIYRELVDKSVPASSIKSTLLVLNEIWAEIKNEAERWKVILPELGEQSAGDNKNPADEIFERLSSFWAELLRTRSVDEERHLLQSVITPGTLKNFEADFRTAWKQNSPLRTIAKSYGFYFEDLIAEEVSPGVNKFGINLLEQKEWFIEGQGYAMRSVAEHLGKNLGESETALVFQKIISGLGIRVADNSREAKDILDVFLGTIPAGELDSSLIVSSVWYELNSEFYRSGNFEPSRIGEYRDNFGVSYRGRYKGVPIIDIWMPAESRVRSVVCGQLYRLGAWRQFWAGKKGDDLELSVELIDDAKAKALLQRNPKLALSHSGQILDEPSAILALQKRVHVQIWERFVFDVINSEVAIRVDVL